MKETVNETTFVTRFADIGRKDNFSIEARRALFEYYEQIEADLGEEIEFDPIAICCDWSEYADALSWSKGYGLNIHEELEESTESACLEFLRNNTQVIEFDGGILVQAF